MTILHSVNPGSFWLGFSFALMCAGVVSIVIAALCTRREATAARVIGDVERNATADCQSCDPRHPESLCADCRAILLEVTQ